MARGAEAGATLQVVLGEYLHEVIHGEQRVARLDAAIEQAVEAAPEVTRAVVEALQGMRSVRKVTAVGVVAEIGQFSRFAHPRQLMGYSGAVPSEFSTGGPGKHHRGAITKTGNAHLRRLLGEAAWCYRFRPAVRYPLKTRQQGLPQKVIAACRTFRPLDALTLEMDALERNLYGRT